MEHTDWKISKELLDIGVPEKSSDIVFYAKISDQDGYVGEEGNLTLYQIGLLAKEIGARLHYGLKVYCPDLSSEPSVVTGIDYGIEEQLSTAGPCVELDSRIYYHISLVRPYLRPLSSMTDSEWSELDEELIKAGGLGYNHQYNDTTAIAYIDFMLRHHFDYRGLIDMKLAIIAPPDMYYETLSDC